MFPSLKCISTIETRHPPAVKMLLIYHLTEQFFLSLPSSCACSSIKLSIQTNFKFSSSTEISIQSLFGIADFSSLISFEFKNFLLVLSPFFHPAVFNLTNRFFSSQFFYLVFILVTHCKFVTFFFNWKKTQKFCQKITHTQIQSNYRFFWDPNF